MIDRELSRLRRAEEQVARLLWKQAQMVGGSDKEQAVGLPVIREMQ